MAETNFSDEPKSPVRISTTLSDGKVAGWRWSNPEKPPLLFCHATGFCASTYKQMLSHLAAEFDIFALDMRGHGRSQLPADPHKLKSWQVYAQDMAAFLDQQTRTGWTLAGHSMGAVTVAMTAMGRSDVAAIKLIEPVAMPSWFSALAASPVWSLVRQQVPMVRQAAKRRAVWDDIAAVQSSYERKKTFQNWAPGVLADYLEDGLRLNDSRAYLACAPAWEAATFAAQANNFWGAVRNAPVPVSVLAARRDRSTVPGDARRQFARHGAQLVVEPQLGHLAPMEKPALVAAFFEGDQPVR